MEYYRELSSEKSVENASKGPDIDHFPVFLPLEKLRSDVVKCTHTLTQERTAAEGRDAKVDDFDIMVIVVALEENVVELIDNRIHHACQLRYRY